jgi:hypothetical protein
MATELLKKAIDHQVIPTFSGSEFAKEVFTLKKKKMEDFLNISGKKK